MSRSRRFALVLGATTALLGVGVVLFAIASGVAGRLVDAYFIQTASIGTMFGAIGFAAARVARLNRGVWVTTLCGALMVVETMSVAVVAWMLRDQPELWNGMQNFAVAPVELPRSVALVHMFERTWLASLGGFLTLGLLYFPDGRLPSPRWRPVVVGAGVGLATFTVANIIEGLPASRVFVEDISVATATGRFKVFGLVLIAVSSLASLASLTVRYRGASTEQRHQIRWMIFGTGVFVVTFIPAVVAAAIGTIDIANVVTALTAILLVAGYGMAVLRYRLYDIDVVINRSVVFGVLALFITGLYATIVVGLGSLIGDPSNAGLAVAATAFVAVVFEPVRARVQHRANVLVYGRRATPYEVLAGMTATGDTSEDRLRTAVRLLGEGTGAEVVAIWTGPPGQRVMTVSWPDADPVSGDLRWDLDVPLAQRDEVVGAVTLRKKKGDRVSDQDARLVDEFVGQASLAVANALLNERLKLRLAEIADSRRRIVGLQDDARRTLERDLHDGAQQQLVGLKIKIGLARRLASDESADALNPLLAGLEEDANDAVETLRDLARGIYPPLLEAEGLDPALRAQSAKSPLPVTVEAGDIARYHRDVEVAVYFCVLEALNNAAKYSRASSVKVSLDAVGGHLVFSVSDDGVGFDPSAQRSGSGLAGMADRLDTIGGVLDVESNGAGSVIRGSVPLDVLEVATEGAPAAVG